jgi:hypothetical protein
MWALEEFQDIPVGLQEGFCCGLESFLLSCTSILPNHYTSEEDEEFVVAKYAEGIELGRLSHGYDLDMLFSLIGYFHTAPLAVIDQGNGKCRVIVNHSYLKNKHSLDLDAALLEPTGKIIINPTTTSIDTIINSTKFQCGWGSFSECYFLVADAPEGSQAAVFDVDSTF